VRLALWTPGAGRPEVAALASALRREAALVVVEAAPRQRPEVDLDLYHLADEARHGFVYRALRERPGLVWLESPSLHALVHSETAGRGDRAGYLREARRAHGPAGAFVAGQVLRGAGGALGSLLTLTDRVLESALALVSESAALAGELEAPLVVVPPLTAASAGATAAVVAELARRVAPQLPEAARRLRESRERDATPLGRALDELRPFARELGLRRLPTGVEPLLGGLFDAPRRP